MARLIQKPTLKTLSNPLLVLIPYILGVTWTLCHPIVSVITGELKARGFYIDEAQLGPYEYNTDPFPVSLGGNSSSRSSRRGTQGSNALDPSVYSNQHEGRILLNLCDALRRVTTTAHNHPPSSLSCHSHISFDVIKVEPAFAPTRPTEAIVIVMPPPDGLTGDVQRATLLTVDRLLERRWLVKALLIVSPHYDDGEGTPDGADGADSDEGANANNDGRLLEAVTRDFMEAISQRDPLDRQDEAVPPLPSSYTRFLIRQLFVLDFTTESPTTSSSSPFLPNKLYILTQGRRGTLPNLDLLSTTSQSFRKHTHQHTLEQRLHPFDTTYYESTYIDRYLIPAAQHIASPSTLPTIRKWAVDLLHLFAFCAHGVLASSSRFGGVSHHSPALDYGIDSLTLAVRLRPQPQRHNTDTGVDPIVGSLFQSVEHLIRGTNSLQERLHHNVNQYLLPTNQSFVSNTEYILPAVLVLLSSVVRAVSLAFVEMDRFDVKGVAGVMVTMVVVTLGTVTVTVVKGVWVGYYEFWMLWLVKLTLMDRLIRWSSSRKEDYEEDDEEESDEDDGGDDDGDGKEKTTLDPMLEETSTVSETNDGTTSVDTVMEEISSRKRRRELRERRLIQSIQFTACLLLIYLHVPIALTHISLALPSILFWTPLIAFPSYDKLHHRRLPNTTKTALIKHKMKNGESSASFVLGCVRYLVGLVALIVIWPPIALTLMGLGEKNDDVSGGSSGGGVVAAAMDSAYVGVVYVPLYVLFSILLLRR